MELSMVSPGLPLAVALLFCFVAESRAEERPIAWGKPREGIACGIATDRDRYELGERVFLAVFVRNTRPKVVRYGVVPITSWRKTADGATEMVLQVDARYGQGASLIVPPGEVRRILVQELPTRPSPNPMSDLHFTPGKTRIAVLAPLLLDRQDGPTPMDVPGGDRSGSVTVEVVVPPDTAAARLACADLGTNSVRIVYADEEKDPRRFSGLWVVDPTSQSEELPLPERCKLAHRGEIPKGTRQLIGRLPGTAHGADQPLGAKVEVRAFQRAGLSLHLVLRRASCAAGLKGHAHGIYLEAALPPLAPGRYELQLDTEPAYRVSDGRVVPVHLHRQNTILPWFFAFDVPAPPPAPKEPLGPALPGSGRSLEEAMRALAFAAVCEATADPRPEGASLESGVSHPTQSFRIIEALVGGEEGRELEWVYSCLWRRERQIARGERLIWVVRNDGSWQGVKALPDTPENRKAVLGTAQALGTTGGWVDLSKTYYYSVLNPARPDGVPPCIRWIEDPPPAGGGTPGGGTLVVRLAGGRLAGSGVRLLEFKWAGTRIEILAQHDVDLRQDESQEGYEFSARVPRKLLPPGRYTVHVAVQDRLLRGWGGYEAAPAGLPTHFRPLTGEITVPGQPAEQ